jgi:hypothetical protein
MIGFGIIRSVSRDGDHSLGKRPVGFLPVFHRVEELPLFPQRVIEKECIGRVRGESLAG